MDADGIVDASRSPADTCIDDQASPGRVANRARSPGHAAAQGPPEQAKFAGGDYILARLAVRATSLTRRPRSWPPGVAYPCGLLSCPSGLRWSLELREG